jgi:hypothetical protein
MLCALGLAGFGWLIYHLAHEGSTTEKDQAIEAEWQPSEVPVLALPDTLEVTYRDLGDKLELTIMSNANPVIDVDVNANHQVDAGDVSYAAGPNNHVCIQKLDTPTNVQCGDSVSEASVRTELGDTMRKTIWRIPKKEIESNRNFADIVIQTFHDDTQKGEFYPQGTPFAKVYRLRFAQIYASSGSKETQEGGISANHGNGESVQETSLPNEGGQSTGHAPSIASFSADPVSSDPTAGFRIHWKVAGAQTVEIAPDIGLVPSEGDRAVSPETTTRYILTASSGATKVTSETTIVVAPASAPRIAAFSAEIPEVIAGGSTRLSWDVEGRVSSVQIDPLGSGLPAQGSREIHINRTTDYLLTATGPGGTVTGKLTVRAKPLGPPEITFEAVPAAVHSGDAVTLRWNVSGADRVKIDSGLGAVASTGLIMLHPTSNQHYTISASGQGGSATRDVIITVARKEGPSRGTLVWTGEVHGTQLINIDRDHVDLGHLEGALPGEACILQLATDKNISIASAPGPRNNYERMVLRVKGNGPVRVVIEWVIQ